MKLWTCTISLCLLAALTVHAEDRLELKKKVGIDQKIGAQVPGDAVFADEKGNRVTLDQYFHGDRPIILSLVYFKCPGLCTTVLNEMNVSLDTMPKGFDVGTKFDVLTISFSPQDDYTLAAKKRDKYLRQYGRDGAEAGWHFLTGDEGSIEKLTKAVGFKYERDTQPFMGGSYGSGFIGASREEEIKPTDQQYIHAGGLIILTPSGKVSKYFYGINYAPRDLRLALTEAAQGKSGSLADVILLYCFHYDEHTGRYTVAVLNILKVIASLLLVVIGFFWIRAMWRERHKPSPLATPIVPPGVG